MIIMDEALISVIIPIYNSEKYLPLCLDSVINSKYKNLEIILVNDGSTDRSLEICDEYAKKDRRIKIITKENGGLSSARNVGLDSATGDYITCVDSDDMITSDFLSFSYEIARKTGAQLVQVGVKITEETGICEDDREDVELFTPEQMQWKLYTDEVVQAWAKLVHREIYDGLRFPEGMVCEDAYLTPKLFHRCEKIAMTSRVGYYYMQWPTESIMRNNTSRIKRIDALAVLEDRVHCFKEWGYSDELYKRSYKDYYDYLISWYNRLKNTEYKKEYKQVKKRMRKCKSDDLILEHRLRCWAMRFGIYDWADKFLKKRGL